MCELIRDAQFNDSNDAIDDDNSKYRPLKDGVGSHFVVDQQILICWSWRAVVWF